MKKIKKLFVMLFIVFSFIGSIKNSFYPPTLSTCNDSSNSNDELEEEIVHPE